MMMIPVRKISKCVPVLNAAPFKKVYEAHSSTHTTHFTPSIHNTEGMGFKASLDTSKKRKHSY